MAQQKKTNISINKPTNIPFQLTKQKIDYFNFDLSYFDQSISVNINEIKLKQNEYLSRKTNLKILDKSITQCTQETVVLNFQTGNGKTKLTYDLIKEYHDQGYYIIVCSPFIKLVEKDYEAINNLFPANPAKTLTNALLKVPIKPAKAIKYNVVKEYDDSYPNDDFKIAMTAPLNFRIHIMTINCFLGNPGDWSFKQGYDKRVYIRNLLKIAKDNKFVIFFDEIHDSVHNFKSDLIPTLLKWTNKVEKVFVSSATFTPATIPTIQILSYLTNKQVSIFQSPRQKNSIQAKIHLHIFNYPYHSKEKNIKEVIDAKIKQYNSSKRPVNIITGTRAMAEEIAERSFPNKTVTSLKSIPKISSLNHINLLTGKTNIPYESNLAYQNNIGTSFKTGVNIDSKTGVLFIVFPTIKDDVRYKQPGIFNDGVSAIIQSIGRIRNGGDIHLFIHEPEVLIDLHKYYGTNFPIKPEKPFIPINDSFQYSKSEYINDYNEKFSQIIIAEANLTKLTKNNPFKKMAKAEFGFWYLNFHEFLLERSQKLIMQSGKPSFGTSISPYVLWACIFDQFINATLVDIDLYENSITIEGNTLKKIRNEFLKVLEGNKNQFSNSNFRDSLKSISLFLGIKEVDESVKTIKYKYKNGIPLITSKFLNRNRKINLEAYIALYNCFTNNVFPKNKIDYLNSCIQEILSTKGSNLEGLKANYKALASLKMEFKNQLSITTYKGNLYIEKNSHNSIDDAFCKKAVQIILEIKEKDIILKTGAISFMQKLKKSNFNDQKSQIFNLLAELNYDISKTPTQINNKQYLKITQKNITNTNSVLLN